MIDPRASPLGTKFLTQVVEHKSLSTNWHRSVINSISFS